MSLYRRDVTKKHTDSLDHVSFYLNNSKSPGVQLHVREPLKALNLQDELKMTHSEFSTSESGALARITGALLGERSNGVLQQEHMLTLGTYLLGVGRVRSDGGVLVLEAPSDTSSGAPYVISTQSKQQLVDSYKSHATLLKGLFVVCAAVGGAVLLYKLVRAVNTFVDQLREDRMFAEVRARMRERRRRNDGGGDPAGADQRQPADGDRVNNAEVGQGEGDDPAANERECVICLVNERSVVLLECGHICVCVDCAEILPVPRLCPVCRTRITRIVPLYHA